VTSRRWNTAPQGRRGHQPGAAGRLLIRHGHPAVAEAFLATCFDGRWGGAYGTLPTGLDVAPILDWALVSEA
jgi:hypothetical protein